MLRSFAAALRRTSERLYRALVIALLALVYVVFLPPFALAARLRARQGGRWLVRDDRAVASRERLLRMF